MQISSGHRVTDRGTPDPSRGTPGDSLWSYAWSGGNTPPPAPGWGGGRVSVGDLQRNDKNKSFHWMCSTCIDYWFRCRTFVWPLCPLYDFIGSSVRTRPQCRLPLGVNLQSISRVRWPHSSYIRGGDIKDFTCLPVPTVVNKTHVFRSGVSLRGHRSMDDMVWYGWSCLVYNIQASQ